MIYNERVESCFFTPKHVGVLDKTAARTVHHRTGEHGRGDFVDLYLKCDKQGTILQACFKAFGNPYLVAAAEWLCQQLEDSQIDEHPCIHYERIIDEFAIPKAHFSVALQIEAGYQKLVLTMQKKLKEEIE